VTKSGEWQHDQDHDSLVGRMLGVRGERERGVDVECSVIVTEVCVERSEERRER
jgi:hypothetical protein